jgi:hypothetical protein
LPEPAEGEEEDEETADTRQEHLDLVDKAKKKIEKINKLHSDVTRFRTTPEHRTIGFVLHVEPIAVSDGPHQFTRDWALIELYEEMIDWDSFKGRHRIKGCSVPFARWAPRWKRRNTSIAGTRA